MQMIIGIIIALIVIGLAIKLALWLIKGLVKILPYLIGIVVIGFGIYGIIYLIKNKGEAGLANAANILLQIVYFGVIFCVLIVVVMFISKILKLIKIRWLMVPVLALMVLYKLGSQPEGYIMANEDAFYIACAISAAIYCWGFLQLVRVWFNIGFNDDIDSNIMLYYGGIGSAFGFIYMYLSDFPNHLLKTNFNSAIYVYVLVYLGALAAILSIYSQIGIYTKVKKFIKQHRICSIDEISANPLSNLQEKERPVFAELITLKMKKHRYIYEINMKTPVYIQAAVYKCVLGELKRGKSFDSVIETVEREFNIKPTMGLIEGIYRTSNIKKAGPASQPVINASKPEPQVSEENKESEEKKTVGTDLQDEPKVITVPQKVVLNKAPEREKYSITEKELMLLRYDMDKHPVISAKQNYRELYFNLLNYILEDLKATSEVLRPVMNSYVKMLDIKDSNIKSIDKESAETSFREIGKKEILKEGFLKYRIRDYRFLLVLEAFYFRYILTDKIEYDLIRHYFTKLNINEKAGNFIIKYLELVVKGNSEKDAEALLMDCKNRYILSTVLSLHNNILWNNLYSDLPKYNVAVCATMSSGKSTFINALLGRDYIPSRNEACTAKITTIADNDRLNSVLGMAFDSSDWHICLKDIDLTMLEELNNNNGVKRIVLESNLDGIKSNKGIVVINDTPGTNYSRDESHNNSTMDFIRNNKIDMVIYIINAEHASATDNQILLKRIKAEVIDKQSSQILFLVNKIDSFDAEKDDDINLCLKGVIGELIEYGFNNPQVIPISANAARLFKMVLKGQQLSKRETASFKNLFELFFTDNLDLGRFCDYRKTSDLITVDENAAVKIGDNEYKHSEILTALHRTNITLVEALLDSQINN